MRWCTVTDQDGRRLSVDVKATSTFDAAHLLVVEAKGTGRRRKRIDASAPCAPAASRAMWERRYWFRNLGFSEASEFRKSLQKRANVLDLRLASQAGRLWNLPSG